MNQFKKNRGLKRYYKNLDIQIDFNEKFWEYFKNSDAWFDNYHTHFDWKGYGNYSFKKREPHLNKLFRHFELFEKFSGYLTKEFQLYVILWDYFSYDDSIYINTPNPNNSEFPITFSGLSVSSNLSNQKLIDYVNKLDDFERYYGHSEEACCLLFKKNIGLNLLNHFNNKT